MEYLDEEGATYVCCTDTGRTLAEVVKELARDCEGSGIRVEFKKTLKGISASRQTPFFREIGPSG